MSSLANRVMVPVSARVPPETSIKDAIAQMHETQESCVLVVQKQRLAGTFTERNLIHSTALAQPLLDAPISTVMIPTAATIFAHEIKDVFAIFRQMQQQHLYHLPVTDQKGKVIGTITQHSLKKGLFPDDTQQTPLEKAAERGLIEQMKGEFIAMVSHEMRTPLTSIYGSIKLLAQGIVPGESEQGQHLLQIAAENSERLVRLVSNILELEQLESGKISVAKTASQHSGLGQADS